MANEINVQALLSFQRDVITFQAAGNKANITQNGTKGLMNQLSVGTTATKLIDTTAPTPIASLGMLFVKNLDTNPASGATVELSLDGSTQVFATLKALEFCLVPINKTPLPAVWAKGSAANVGVVIGATEI